MSGFQTPVSLRDAGLSNRKIVCSETSLEIDGRRALSAWKRSLASILIVLSFVAVSLSTANASAAGADNQDQLSATGGYVRVGWCSDFQNWNPLTVEMVSDWVAYNLVYSTLFKYDEDLNLIECDLATSYAQMLLPSGGMNTYINITENAYFRNAENPMDTSHPLTAADVAFTLQLILDNPGGAWDYYVSNMTEVEVTGPFSIRIETDMQRATLIDDLVWIPILPEYVWSAIPSSQIYRSMHPDALIGSGPFYYEDGVTNSWYNFARAPNYHAEADYGDARDIDYEGIQFQVFNDINTLVFAINTGEVDVVDVTGIQMAAWDAIGSGASVPITKQVTQELGIYDIAINAIPLELREAIGYAESANKILLDPTVREAIGMTLDKETLAYTYFYGFPSEADSVLNPGFWHADIPDPLPFDPWAARALLIDAGYEDTDADGYLEVTASSRAYIEGWADIGDELNFRLQVPDVNPGFSTIGMVWVSWAADAGVHFDFEVLPIGPMTNDQWYKCEYDVWVWSWYWGPEPLSNLACWLTDQIRIGGYNSVGPICQGGLDEADGWWWVDEANAVARCGFDDTFDEALRTIDRDDRKALVDQLQIEIYNTYTEFPPMYAIGQYAFTTARYDGWGNWTAHIGRTIISDMPWLWYDLRPNYVNELPVFDILPLSFYETTVGDPITFAIAVSDPEGDEITVNWSSGDGANEVVVLTGDTTMPRPVNWTHVYAEPGTYVLRIGLSDGHHEYENVDTAMVNIVSGPSFPPIIDSISYDPATSLVGQDVTWLIVAMDLDQGPEGDGLLFLWDWDDGTYSSSYYHPVENGTYVADMQVHSWSEPGTYEVTASVRDGLDPSANNVSVTVPYTVEAPSETFVVTRLIGPDSLDPATDYETSGGEVIQNVYETLLFYDETSAVEFEPVLATAVPTVENGLISPDGLIYTFPLREDVEFHDGTPMMADDVAYSIQRVLRMHDYSGPSWMFEAVMTHYISYYVGESIQYWIDSEGVDEPWLLDALPPDTSTILEEEHLTAVAESVAYPVGNYTVQFRLTSSYAGFRHILATTVASIVSKDYVESHGGVVNGEPSAHMSEHMCGSGPFMLQSWDVGSNVHLTRNDNYWGLLPELGDVYILSTDVDTGILMLESGDADSIYLPIDYEDLFIGDENYTIVKGLPTFDMMFAGFNWDINTTAAAVYGSDVPEDFFHDVHVRRAFAHLMDYDLFIDYALRGNGEQPNGAIPRGMFGYDESVPKYEYSLAQVQAELQLATNPATGNSWWDDGFTIALLFNAGNTYRQTVCELLKDALEGMGSQFTVHIYALDWPTYLDELRNAPSPLPMFWLGWAPDNADPDDYMTPFLDSDFGIFPYTTRYSNETIDDIIRSAATELDAATRADLYSEASMLVYEDVPYIWLYQAGSFHIQRSWVTGYYHNPMLHGLDYSRLGVTGGPTNLPPVASFSVYVNGTTVYVDASASYDPDGMIVSYDWNWGDGTTGTGETTSHTYTPPGATEAASSPMLGDAPQFPYLIAGYTIDIAGDPLPYCIVTVTNVRVGLSAVVTSDDTGGYQYDLSAMSELYQDGDEILVEAVKDTLSGSAVCYVDLSGVYTVVNVTLVESAFEVAITLTVTDDDGLTATMTQTVVLELPGIPPVASFTVYVNGSTIFVDASESYDPDGVIVSYDWDWGDGTTGTGETASHTYVPPETAAVASSTILGVPPMPFYVYGQTMDEHGSLLPYCTVTITDVDKSTSTVVESSSEGYYMCELSSLGEPYYEDGDEILVEAVKGTLAGSAVGYVDVSYPFLILNVTLSDVGFFEVTVTLTVTDNDGLTGTTSQTVLLEQVGIPPVASFTVSVDGLTVHVDASESYDLDGTIVSYDWDWGDGTTGTGETATHTYALLEALALAGASNPMLGAPQLPYIIVGQTMDVAGDPLPYCTVTVTNVRTGLSAVTMSDGTGIYQYNLANMDEFYDDGDEILVEAVKNMLSGSAVGYVDTSGYFTMINVTLVEGMFEVTITLTVTDDDGLTATMTQAVEIGQVATPPVAVFTVTPESGDVSTIFTFDASSSFDAEDPVDLLQAQWDWDGDGIWDTVLSTDKVASHQFETEGVHTVFLRVVDTDGMEGLAARNVSVYGGGAEIPIQAGTSITIYEQSGDVNAYTFSVAELCSTGANFTTVAMISETYFVSVAGDYLLIECFREPLYPSPGTGTGNNIVAVRLDGVPGYPDGLWATAIVSYVMGVDGIEDSRWNALGPADQIGPYGDSLCTYLGDYYSNIVLGWSAPVIVIEAMVDIDKSRINLAAQGGYLTAYIELPEGYDVADIDITTVAIEGVVFADPTFWSIGDYDDDGIADLWVRFERENLSYVLGVADEVVVTISGALNDGTMFQGSDTVQVVDSKGGAIAAALIEAALGNLNLGTLAVAAIALSILAGIACSDRFPQGRVKRPEPADRH